MASQHILCLPRSDEEGSFVVVNVKSDGSGKLDLCLVATENESPYVGKIQASNIKKLQSSNFKGTEDEWSLILSRFLLQQPLEGHELQVVQGIEAVGSVISGKHPHLEITIRKNISGITQRLGAIQLSQDDDEEVDMFDWAAASAQAFSTAQSEIVELKLKFTEQRIMMAKLSDQLDQLIKAKDEHEDAMLEKFRLLLNAKKLKIRDQQRVIATAKVDPETAVEVQSARNDAKPRKPVPSRKGKRKVAVAKPEPEEEPEEEPEAMQVDPETEDEDEDAMPARMTPESSDASETEDDDIQPVKAPPAPAENKPPRRGRSQRLQESQVAEPAEVAVEELEQPPPRRALPFMKSASQSKEKETSKPIMKPQRPIEEDDDETDDEL